MPDGDLNEHGMTAYDPSTPPNDGQPITYLEGPFGTPIRADEVTRSGETLAQRFDAEHGVQYRTRLQEEAEMYVLKELRSQSTYPTLHKHIIALSIGEDMPCSSDL